MKSHKRILILNISMEMDNSSLAFTSNWVNKFSEKFQHVDVFTLYKQKNLDGLNENIKVYGFSLKKSSPRILKLIRYFQITNLLLKKNEYDLIFSHMSPILITLLTLNPRSFKIKKVLWYTHDLPKELYKKIILYISLKITDVVVTASQNSFPFKSKKVKVIGHGINKEFVLSNFNFDRNHNVAIIGRITRSKNIKFIIDSLLSSDFKNKTIHVVGEAMTKKDRKYMDYLQNRYKLNKNVEFLGKVNFENLPLFLQNYSFNFNGSTVGFYDKIVLETLGSNLINFYTNDDYDKLFNKKYSNYLKFSVSSNDLVKKINEFNNVNINEIENILKSVKSKIHNQTTETIVDRILVTVGY